MHLFQFLQGQTQAHARQVDRLSAAHTERTGSFRQQAHHRELPHRVQPAVRQYLECLRLQGVAYQQGTRFVVLHMHGRFTTPQGVVIHARHIVMHQRIRVDHFDRGRRARQFRRIGIEQGTCCIDQQGTNPLAAIQHCVMHGFMQASRYLRDRRQMLHQSQFHFRLR
ncbi:hypothetical protein D3C81_1543970 [compost metagenome]